MSTPQWNTLKPTTQALIAGGAMLDLALKTWALVDLVNRPAEQVPGTKTRWAIALTLLNTAGVLPAVYLTKVLRRR